LSSGPKVQIVKITGFYVNAESEELLVSSMDDGYVFPIDMKFAETLQLSRTFLFKPYFHNFEIDEKHNVTGRLKLVVVEKNLTETQEQKLKELGFTRNRLLYLSDDLTFSKELSGKRYKIEGDLPLEKLEKGYSVQVSEAESVVVSAGRIIATPAKIVIGTVAAVPLAFLIVGAMVSGSP